MASENDMRRHTTFEPNLSTTSLTSESAASTTRNGRQTEDVSNGGGSSDLVGTSGADAAATAGAVDAGATSSHEAQNGAQNGAAGVAGAPRQDDEPFDRPESPPIQEQTPKHHRFSMLKFRTASDSQLSARSRQHQQNEKPPPMPHRTCRAFPCCCLPSSRIPHLSSTIVIGSWLAPRNCGRTNLRFVDWRSTWDINALAWCRAASSCL